MFEPVFFHEQVETKWQRHMWSMWKCEKLIIGLNNSLNWFCKKAGVPQVLSKSILDTSLLWLGRPNRIKIDFRLLKSYPKWGPKEMKYSLSMNYHDDIYPFHHSLCKKLMEVGFLCLTCSCDSRNLDLFFLMVPKFNLIFWLFLCRKYFTKLNLIWWQPFIIKIWLLVLEIWKLHKFTVMI